MCGNMSMESPSRVGLARRAKLVYELISETLDEYTRDRGEMVAAGLAFFTLLSLAPLIIIAVAIAGAVLGHGTAQQEALRSIAETMGPGAAETVRGWVQQASDAGGVASVMGFALLLLGASRLAAQLRLALNQVWNVDEYLAEGFKASVSDYVKRRLFAFLFVLASGPLLLVVVASRAVLTGVSHWLFAATPFTGTLVQLSQFGLSLLLVALISAAVFRVVPDTRVGWRAVLPGAMLTSVLFNLGNLLVGLYLGRASVTETYGAAGSLVVVLLWLFFSSQFFLLGAEFTQVYARHFGRALSGEERAELSRAENERRRVKARLESEERQKRANRDREIDEAQGAEAR
jgi:membrane protein